MPPELRVLGIAGIGEILAGANLGDEIADAAERQQTPITPGDIVVVAQKIVSKAEGRLVEAATREEARDVARREARRIVRETPMLLICETHHGFVCANAGVDLSNVDDGRVALLPRDPDASATRIRGTIEDRVGTPVGVIVSDTFGRPWRLGQTNVAIGASGIAAIRDHRGEVDPAGRTLDVTEIAQIDEIAGAAELAMRKLDRVPAAIVRGYAWTPSEGRAADLLRPISDDLFR